MATVCFTELFMHFYYWDYCQRSPGGTWVSRAVFYPTSASIGGVEGPWEVSTDSLVSISERQLDDCSNQNSGCHGGLLDSESSYQYITSDGTRKIRYITAILLSGVTGYMDVPVVKLTWTLIFWQPATTASIDLRAGQTLKYNVEYATDISVYLGTPASQRAVE